MVFSCSNNHYNYKVPVLSLTCQHCKANDLIIAVPEKYGRHILGRTFFNRNMLQTPFKEDVSPDILTNHVRYSSEIKSTFKNAKMITIVRNPVEHFVSSFEFFHNLGTELSLYYMIHVIWTIYGVDHIIKQKAFEGDLSRA